MASSPSRTPFIVLPFLTIVVLCLTLVAMARRREPSSLFPSRVDSEISRLANIPWLSKQGRAEARARKIAEERRVAQERRKQLLKVSERVERLRDLQAEKAVAMQLKAQRDEYIHKAQKRQKVADDIETHSRSLQHAANLIAQKEQNLVRMRYQPLQQEEEKTQQMLLTASEILSEDKASLHAREQKVLEQRHAAQKAAQVGNLNALRRAEALLPDLKAIAAGERAEVKADRRREEQIKSKILTLANAMKEAQGELKRDKKEENKLLDASSEESAIAKLISKKSHYFDDIAAEDAAKLRFNDVLELLHEKHADHKQAKKSLAAITNNIQDWKRKELSDVASLKSAAAALKAQH